MVVKKGGSQLVRKENDGSQLVRKEKGGSQESW